MSAFPPIPDPPGYWMNETSGVLQPVVEKYLAGDELEADELTVMRLYLRQWMNAPFLGPEVRSLRLTIEDVTTTERLRLWLRRAQLAGVDPL